MKHVFAWQVVRRFSWKIGCEHEQLIPLAMFENEQDAVDATKILDSDLVPKFMEDRSHTVERLELTLFESLDEFKDSR